MTPRRTRQLLAALALASALVTSGCTSSGDEPSTAPTAGATGTASSTAPGVPAVPSGPPATTASAVGTTTASPVGTGEAASFGDGLTATVTRVEDVTLTARGPGEVAGPGVAVRMTLQNDTGARIDLGGVTVNASFQDGAPGDISTAEPSDVPTGVLEPGADVEGVWVFSRPTGDSSAPEISVSSISSGTVVVIRG